MSSDPADPKTDEAKTNVEADPVRYPLMVKCLNQANAKREKQQNTR